MTVNEALLMDLADCGSPERLLGVILDHHRDWKPPVDIETFARTVGILEFRDLEVDGFVGALMTDLEKTKGIILSAAGLPAVRRRFTVAHELGHFLIAAHRGDKQCTSKDLMETRRETLHQKEEVQANRFAAGLLMPKPWFVAQTDDLGPPALEHLRILAATYSVSLEAAANRYAELTAEACAFVFLRGGRIRYARPSRSFPTLSVRPGDHAPTDCIRAAVTLGGWSNAAAAAWLRADARSRLPQMRIQVMNQRDTFQTVLLHIEEIARAEEDELDDLIESYTPRFGR
ncbi:ImmA/IrrE family metallo-endopeptidase [Sphingomonas floccifaciens]|uniref:ImmA/IrrE family metallo-endopeptidase n=1 Tax=Sphingomonas floccifaciens TaxID=1844115 RepID=A0ABW4N8N3_9SPHN